MRIHLIIVSTRMGAKDNIAAWRDQWPDGSARLDRIVRAAARAGYSRVIMWGSVALGDYVYGQSDVDLLLVCPGEAIAVSDSLLQEITGDGQWSMDVLAITEQALASPSPVCMRKLSPVAPYELHGMDLVQLREYSAPLAGSPVDDLVEFRDTRAESRDSLEHVLGVMVPRHVEASSTATASKWLLAQRRDFSFVLIRCLYSLRQGDIGSKSTAAAWASEEYLSDPVHGVVSQAGARLLAYRRSATKRVACGAGTISQFTGLAAAIEQIAHFT